MAMATMPRAPVLQQRLASSRPASAGNDVRDSRSLRSSSSRAFCCSGVTIRGSGIALAPPATRSALHGSWHACRAMGGGAGGGEGGADGGAQEEKGDSSSNNSATSVASPAPAGEPKLSSSSSSAAGGEGAKGFGPASKSASPKSSTKSSSGSARRSPPSKPLIGVSPADQQAQQVETAIVASLAFLFAVIFLEGLLLAGSGFLPEEWDEFAVNSVYPAFTPTVGVFLAIAASYGLWKTLGSDTGQSGR